MDRREFIKTAAVATLPVAAIESVVLADNSNKSEINLAKIFADELPIRHLFIYDNLEKCDHAVKGGVVPYLMADTRWTKIGIASMPFNRFWQDDVLKCLDEIKLNREDCSFILSHRIITEDKYKEIMNKVNVRIEWKWDIENKRYLPLKVIGVNFCGNDEEAIYIEV